MTHPIARGGGEPVFGTTPVGLTPLLCAACGGAVPLGDGDAVACPWFTQSEFEPRAPEAPLDPQHPVVFTAAWDAWFRIDFRAPGGKPGVSWPVCFALTPAARHEDTPSG